MNSIATPRKTDNELIEWGLARLQTFAAMVIFTLLLVSFKPYAGEIAKTGAESGDAINQLGFGSIGLISIGSLVFLVNRDVARQIIGIWWWLLLAFGLISVQQSYLPDAALRAYLFTLFAIAGVLAVLTLPSGAGGLQRTLVVGGAIALLMCYAGLVLYPELATHTAYGTREPEHAGLWRGLYSHKNIAGPVMAAIAFIGIMAFRMGSHLTGIVLSAAAFFFVAHTGSKTSAALVPLVMLLVLLPGIFGFRRFAATIIFLAIFGFLLVTIGTELFGPLKALRETYAPKLTFTGRTQIWEFGLQHLASHPLRGFGFESFWLSPFVKAQEVSYESDWDVRGIIHGHNGYLDIAINMGVPALFAALMAMIVSPLRDYARCIKTRENVIAADFFMMVYAFTALNACLESFFFRRADPVWLMFVLGVFGLRLTARFALPSAASTR